MQFRHRSSKQHLLIQLFLILKFPLLIFYLQQFQCYEFWSDLFGNLFLSLQFCHRHALLKIRPIKFLQITLCSVLSCRGQPGLKLKLSYPFNGTWEMNHNILINIKVHISVTGEKTQYQERKVITLKRHCDERSYVQSWSKLSYMWRLHKWVIQVKDSVLCH